MPKRSNTSEFIEKAKLIHSKNIDFLDYSKVEYVGNLVHVEIICLKDNHGSFFQIPKEHLNGCSCPKCGRLSSTKNRSYSNEEIINKFKIIHNGIYNYDEVYYINNHTKIKIKCDVHGYFLQLPQDHLKGHGCSKCGKAVLANKTRLSVQEFINRSNLKHNFIYDYGHVVYINNMTKVDIICKTHGKFQQIPAEHMVNLGCPKCTNNVLTNELFIERANLIHNFKYDYYNINYVSQSIKINIICEKHGLFKQSPNDHLRGRGCPKCSKTISKPEIAWLNSLSIDEKYRQFNIRINSKLFKFDAYDPTTNTIYEFYGDFWHGNPKVYKSNDINKACKKSFGELYKNTMKREALLKAAGYNIITIWESDYHKL